jgi:hypothetical protein
MKLVRDVPSLDDEIIVCEPESSRFEVALLVTIRARHSFVVVAVVSVVLLFAV